MGEGPPVLFIQGVGVGAEGWRPQIGEVSRLFRCLSYDNRGLGASQPAGDPVTVELMAEDALALMDAQRWSSAHVVGHSLGGLVSLFLARAARVRVRSLALLCTFATGAIPTRMTPAMIALGMRTRIGTRRMRRRAFLSLVMPSAEIAKIDAGAEATRLAALFGHDLAESPPIAMKQFAAMKQAAATPFLRELKHIPTLVVSATHDRIAPPSAGRTLAEGIPGARYVEIPDAAHGMTIHRAARINALLLEHLTAAEAAVRSATA